MRDLFFAIVFCCFVATPILSQESSVPDTATMQNTPDWMKGSVAKLEKELTAKYGAPQQARISRGLTQVSEYWRAQDGDAAAFEDFARTNFAGDPATLDAMFNRYERLLEQLSGHMHEINREFRQQADLDLGPILPFDGIFAAYDPSAHFLDDFFANKGAFVVLLNFPLTTLQERLTQGPQWTRRQWAEVRLAQAFSKRIPADVNLAIAQAGSDSAEYIAQYNIWMHHLLDQNGERPFPPKLRLLSHWNLRDEIKADYADTQNGLRKQRMIQQVMEHIVRQTIPLVVINNPNVDWNPRTNAVTPAAEKDSDLPAPTEIPVTSAPEPDTRYAVLLKDFVAVKKADPYSPTAPTFIARRFDEDREIPEKRVEAMFEQVLASPLVPQVAKLIQSRLGRPLEPFDIWYDGFRPRAAYTEAQLDAIVAKKYPTAEAYQKDIPNLLVKLGFTPEKAAFLANNIIVDPARGSGHAMGAEMRSEKAHLRTRVEKTGMNYKGYNIAIHEMGHNVEETFSLNDIDHTLLNGVPNTAFTEALAFVFQSRDMELLGLLHPTDNSRALETLNDFWGAYEIAGVVSSTWACGIGCTIIPAPRRSSSMMPRCKSRQNIWNRYYAPVFRKKDVVLLGIYSHMIDSFLYLPDYPMGHMIAYQIEEQMKKAGNTGPEFERMATMGQVTPDLWMEHATGKPVGPEPLLAATEKALVLVGSKK